MLINNYPSLHVSDVTLSHIYTICSGTGVEGRRESRTTRAVVLPQDIDLALAQKYNDKRTASKTLSPLHATAE